MHAFTHADVMNQLAAREQLRLKDIPSLEQINAKDGDLGQLLSKLTTSISGRRVDVTGGQVRGGRGRGGRRLRGLGGWGQV